jgi:hypothetical protein
MPNMAKTPRYDDDDDDDKKTKAAPKAHAEPPAGGSGGNPGHDPVDLKSQLTEQEKIAAEAPDDGPDKVPSDPKKPYPTGNPPTEEQERRRAMGLPREPTEDEKRSGKRPEK